MVIGSSTLEGMREQLSQSCDCSPMFDYLTVLPTNSLSRLFYWHYFFRSNFFKIYF